MFIWNLLLSGFYLHALRHSLRWGPRLLVLIIGGSALACSACNPAQMGTSHYPQRTHRYFDLRAHASASSGLMAKDTKMALTVRKRAYSDPCSFSCTYFTLCGSQQADTFCPRCRRLICVRCERKRLKRPLGNCGHRCERPPRTSTEPTEWGPAAPGAANASSSSSSASMVLKASPHLLRPPPKNITTVQSHERVFKNSMNMAM